MSNNEIHKNIWERAVETLKSHYDHFNRPGTEAEFNRLVRNMKARTTIEIEEFEEADVERVVSDYLCARGWK